MLSMFRRSSDPRLTFNLDHDGVRVRLLRDQELVPLKEWLVCCARCDAEKVMILRQSQELDLESSVDFELFISYDDLYEIDKDDLRTLEIAPFFPFDTRLDSYLDASMPEFKIHLRYLNTLGQEMVGMERRGGLVRYGTREWLLTPSQYLLANAVEACNASSDAVVADRLQLLARVQERALAASAAMDEYLSTETIIVPDSVFVRPRNEDDGSLSVLPVIDGLGEDLLPILDRRVQGSPRVQPLLSLEDSQGRRTRIIASPQIREALEQIKRQRRLTGERRRRLLERPREVLSQPAITLDDFSDRVKEIGLYQYRFYPFLSKKPGDWIPDEIGITFEREDGEGETERLTLTPEAVEELLAAYEQATREGHSTFEYDGKRFSITGSTGEQLRALKQAVEQLAQRAGPGEAEPGHQQPQVLIIYENVEEQDYTLQVATEAEAPTPTVQVPGTLGSDYKLLRHQLAGLAWMQSLAAGGARNGGLLADDMGLGKTLQIWSFFESLRSGHTHDQECSACGGRCTFNVLVVAPVGLLEVWREEYHKFFTGDDALPREMIYILHDHDLRRMRHEGAGREIIGRGAGTTSLDLQRLLRYPVILTSYETVRDYQFSLCQIEWSAVVVDEAQRVKNPTAMTTHAIKALKTRFFLVSTGTPVENDLADLWCLLDITVPGRLGSLREFKKAYDPKTEDDLESLSERVKHAASPNFLRRRKKDILDLPAREDLAHAVPMSELQRQQYLASIQAYRMQQDRNQSAMLGLLLELRKLSCFARGIESLDIENSAEEALAHYSGKMAWTISKLREIREAGEKALIFIEFKDMQRLIARVIRKLFGLDVDIINGDTSARTQPDGRGENRRTMIKRFEAKPGFNVLILSPVAAGVGLTITEANHVIHFTRHWNPAKEDQATDRVYRIGQHRKVHVHCPMATAPDFSTFDETLNELLVRKRKLAENALFPTLYTSDLSGDDLSAFISGAPQQPDAALSRDVLESLSEREFIALMAAIKAREGYDVEVTLPPHRGVHVLARKGGETLAIACRWGHTVTDQALFELETGLGYYRRFESNPITPVLACMVVPDPDLQSTARAARTQLVGFADLDTLVRRLGIGWADIKTWEMLDFVRTEAAG